VSLLANTVTVYRFTKPLVNVISYPERIAYNYEVSTLIIIAILLPKELIWVDKWPDTKQHQAIYRINTEFLLKPRTKPLSIRLGVILFHFLAQ